MVTVASLNTKKQSLLNSAQLLLDDGKQDTSQYRQLIKDVEDTQLHIDLLSRTERDIASRKTSSESVPAPVVAAPAIITERPELRERRVSLAYRDLFRDGRVSAEQRALLTITDADGGAFVSQAFDDVFIEASKYYGPIYNLVHRRDASDGSPTKVVVTDSTNQTFSLLTEGSTLSGSTAQQPTIFSHVNSLDTLISSTVFSVQELDDAFSLQTFLTRQMGLAVSRARETAVTVGTTNDGTSTALPHTTPTGGLLAAVPTGATTASLAGGVGYADLVDLASSVDRSYYANGVFMASPSTEAVIQGQKDGMGNPYYKTDPNTGLLIIGATGKLLYPNAAMPAYGTASSPVVVFGDFSRAWNVVSAPVRVRVVGNQDGDPALALLTRRLQVWVRIGQSAGVSGAVKALMTASS